MGEWCKTIKESREVFRFKNEFIEILGNKCFKCGGIRKEFHHITYEDLPSPRIYTNKKFVELYSKYLRPVCRDCHIKIHYPQKNK